MSANCFFCGRSLKLLDGHICAVHFQFFWIVSKSLHRYCLSPLTCCSHSVLCFLEGNLYSYCSSTSYSSSCQYSPCWTDLVLSVYYHKLVFLLVDSQFPSHLNSNKKNNISFFLQCILRQHRVPPNT